LFQESTYYYKKESTGSDTLSFSSPSLGVVELTRNGSLVGQVTLFPSPILDRVLSYDGSNLVWRVDATTGTGGSTSNDYVTQAAIGNTTLVLTRSDSAQITCDLPPGLDSRYALASSFSSHLVTNAVTIATSVATSQNYLQGLITALTTRVAALETAIEECTRVQVSVGGTTTFPNKYLQCLPAQASQFSQGSNIGTDPSYMLSV
jgi:hypothetical protein